MLFALEEADQVVASGEAESEAAAPRERATVATRRGASRGSLPAHLPGIEMVVDLEDHACPCCPNVLHRIRAEVSERLDIVPAQFRVLFVHRPKYACQACEEVVMQVPAPARLGRSSGLPTDAAVAQALGLQVRLSSATLPQTQIYILGRALTAVTLRTPSWRLDRLLSPPSEAEFWAEATLVRLFGLWALRQTPETVLEILR